GPTIPLGARSRAKRGSASFARGRPTPRPGRCRSPGQQTNRREGASPPAQGRGPRPRPSGQTESRKRPSVAGASAVRLAPYDLERITPPGDQSAGVKGRVGAIDAPTGHDVQAAQYHVVYPYQ